MTALLLLSLVPVAMWLGQTVMLRAYGLPVRWRIHSSGAPRAVRTAGRIITYVSLLSVIAAYPLTLGQSPADYYGALLPLSPATAHLPQGAAASVLFLCMLFGAWLAAGRLRVEVRQSTPRYVRRLLLLVPSALGGALVEELLFRGALLADLDRSLPNAPGLAFGIAVVVFAGAHYVRKVKRRWTIGGHLMLGVLLCLAFRRTETLWLSIGLHAGGNMMILGTRGLVRYKGPAWITGESVFPYAGLVGVAGLAILAAFVLTHYGAP